MSTHRIAVLVIHCVLGGLFKPQYQRPPGVTQAGTCRGCVGAGSVACEREVATLVVCPLQHRYASCLQILLVIHHQDCVRLPVNTLQAAEVTPRPATHSTTLIHNLLTQDMYCL
jgi:hypothetical protein